MYTTSHAFLDALTECGVSHVFANFGSDHPALLEAMAEARATGRPIPRIITSPHEMVAMSAAHGFYQVSGVAQAVVVHVDCGTQSLAGALHNASKARIPMLVFAGASPFTQQGELRGSRNEYIQWIQDVRDQRGIVRGYVKHDQEIRTGTNVGDLVRRAFQLARTDPKGPTYLMGAREIMEAEAPPQPAERDRWTPVAPGALREADARVMARALAAARSPLIVTSYLGRRPSAVSELVALTHRLAIGVLESVPSYMNFPHDDPLFQGNQWNEQSQNQALAEADVILVIDSDVPWIPTVSRPATGAAIFHVDVDPLKEHMPLWHIASSLSCRADAATALAQIRACLDAEPLDTAAIDGRRARLRDRHEQRTAAILHAEQPHADGTLTLEYAMACLRSELDADTIVLNESITNFPIVCDHLAVSRPGTMFGSGGGSLGWNGGAAIGAKLARPDKTVVAITGDGSYLFSIPASVHWMSRQYGAPFLQIVLNNGGWAAPRVSALTVHPDGFVHKSASPELSFDPAPDYAGIAAAAGGAEPFRIERADQVAPTLTAAMKTVRTAGRSAVVDLRIGPSR